MKPVQEFLKTVPKKYKKLVATKGVLAFFNEPLKTTLTELQNAELEKDLLAVNALMLEICNSKELLCSSIKTLVKSVMEREQEFVNEVYLQLYRQSNNDSIQSAGMSKEFYEKSLFLISVVSCYILPSDSLADPLMNWVHSEVGDLESNESFVKDFLARLEYRKSNVQATPHYWVPSSPELLAKFKGQPLKLSITFCDDVVLEAEIQNSTTVKSVMGYLREKSQYLSSEPDNHMYWLYRVSSRKGQLDKALPAEAKYSLV